MRRQLKNSFPLAIALFACTFVACGNSKSFDSKTWLEADQRGRGRMSQHLVDSKVLIGRSLEETKVSLGEPERDWGSVVQYNIDLGWPFKDPKNCGLQVHFDANRHVREVKIVD